MIAKQIDKNTFEVMNGGVPERYKCGDCKSIYLSNLIYRTIFGIPRCNRCEEKLEKELNDVISEAKE